MPASTNGYHYMLDTDPLADVAAIMQSLAVDVEAQVGNRARGTASVPVASGAPNGTLVVVFPTGKFATTPRVQLTVQGTSVYHPAVTSKSATQMTISVRHVDNANAAGALNVSVDWEATEG